MLEKMYLALIAPQLFKTNVFYIEFLLFSELQCNIKFLVVVKVQCDDDMQSSLIASCKKKSPTSSLVYKLQCIPRIVSILFSLQHRKMKIFGGVRKVEGRDHQL